VDLLAVDAVSDPALGQQVGARFDAGDTSPAPPHQINAAGAIVELPDENGLVLAGTVGDRMQNT